MLRRLARRPDTDAVTHSYTVTLPEATIARLEALAEEAGKLLGCRVSRAAVLRAPLVEWVEQVDQRLPREILEEVRRAEPVPDTPLQTCKAAWSNKLNRKLEKHRKSLGGQLLQHAARGRSALLLAALAPWLMAAERHLQEALKSIRAALVKTGRPTR